MLQAIVRWSIHNRGAVVALASLLTALGALAVANARFDVFPEFAPPQVIVQTEAPGLAADEVEPLVTLPIEQAMLGVPGLDVLRSQSIQGLSVATLIFRDGTEIHRARQLVAERLAEVNGQLPEGVRPPRLGPLTSSTGRLLVIGLTSETMSGMNLRDWAQWTLRPRLLAVPGVAQVTLFGGGVREFQVLVDPDRLIAHGLTLTEILDAARRATGVRGAGFQEDAQQRSIVRVEARARSADDLGAAVVSTSNGSPIRLRDVARVVDAPEPKLGDAAIDGVPGVTLDIFKQFGGDTPATTRRVEDELDRLRPTMDRLGIVYHPALFRQADFIRSAVGNVTHSLLVGAGLVAVVLLLFLFNLRTALISMTAIPLSLLGAIVALSGFGIGLDTMTLGGLAIAVGEVVDDAIIDVENIFRRLRENGRLRHPRSPARVVLSASMEVRGAVVYATFIVVLVFVPVFLMGGIQGRLFAPLGYAYALAVLASLAVALTVTPALAMMLLPGAEGAEEPPLLRRLQGVYDRLLRRMDRELPLVATILVVLVGSAGWAFAQFGGESLPEMRENHLVLHMQGLPGTSLPQSMSAGAAIARELRRIPGVGAIAQQAGRAELGEDTWGVEYSETEVNLTADDPEEVEAVGGRIRSALRDHFPGFSFEVFSFLSERIEETVTGSIAPVAVKVVGDDLDSLDRASRMIAEAMAEVAGAEGVRPEAQTGQPELVVRLRPDDAASFGLLAADVLDAVHAAYQGAEVTQAYDRNRIITVVVILDPKYREDPTAVDRLWLDAPGGGRIRLGQVADVFRSDGRFLIRHEGGLRQQLVTSGVRGRDVESFVDSVDRRLQALDLPSGVTYSITGAHEIKRAAQRELLILGTAAGAGIVWILGMAFGSIRRLILVLANLPFAMVGGVAAVYMMGGVLDVGSMVGFVTLLGITTRNSIMMVSHWQHLHDVEGMPMGLDLIVRGACERLAPVLMTATVTALGLLPIAASWGRPGSEIEGPMAMVILGGLVTSTALNLLGLPVLYRRFGASRPVG